MALGTYTEGGIGVNTSGAPIVSTAFTPAVADTIIVLGGAYRTSATPTPPTITSSPSLTWTLIGEASRLTDTHRVHVRAWYAIAASAVSTTVTITSTATTDTIVQCSRVSGASTDFSNVQTGSSHDTTNGPSIALTLPSVPTAGNYATYTFLAVDGAGTTPTGYASFGVITGSSGRLTQFHDVTNPTSSATSGASSASDAAAIMFEIKASGGATPKSLLLPQRSRVERVALLS